MALSVSIAAFPPRRILRNALAGAVVGIIALPLSIALAIAVGAEPIAGLYTAIFAGAVAAATGGSRYNITGPTAALVPLLHAVALRHGAGALPLVGIMAGVLLVATSRLRVGRLVRFVPGPVLVGFTAGIAASIAFGQVNTLLGLSGTDPHLEHFAERAWDTITHLGTMQPSTPLLALACVAALLAWQRARIRVPGALVVVAAATAAVGLWGLDTVTLEGRYGALPQGLPLPHLPPVSMSLVLDLLPSAAAIALLAGVESLLSALVADGMSRGQERHDPDAELRGQGLGNIASALMGGVPSTAAIARTGANIRSGADSRLAGVFHALTVLALTMALAPLTGGVPLAALAAVLVVVAWNIADVPEVSKLVRTAPRADAAVLVATMLITLVFDLTYAIGLGVIASLVLLVRSLLRVPAAAELAPDATGHIRPVSHALSERIRSRPDIAFFNATGVISFHCAEAMEHELRGDARPLVVRMRDVAHVDATGLATLEGIIERRQRAGRRTLLTAMRPQVREALARYGILRLLGPANFHESTGAAIDALTPPERSTAA